MYTPELKKEYNSLLGEYLATIHCVLNEVKKDDWGKYVLFEGIRFYIPIEFQNLRHFHKWRKYGDYYLK